MAIIAANGGEDKRVKCVRIATTEEVKGKSKEHETYDLLRDHDVFINGELCPVSQLVGMPLFVTRLRPSLRFTSAKTGNNTRNSRRKSTRPLTYGYDTDGDYYPNRIVSNLMISCNVTTADGQDSDAVPQLTTPLPWSGNVGSVILARADGKDLYPHHVQVLLDFIVQVTQTDHTAAEKHFGASGAAHTPEDIIEAFALGYFHEFYLMRSGSWKEADETLESKRNEEELALLKPRSPFPHKVRSPVESNRDPARKKFENGSLQDKLQIAQGWRERCLLLEIAELRRRLGESTGELNNCGAK